MGKHKRTRSKKIGGGNSNNIIIVIIVIIILVVLIIGGCALGWYIYKKPKKNNTLVFNVIKKGDDDHNVVLDTETKTPEPVTEMISKSNSIRRPWNTLIGDSEETHNMEGSMDGNPMEGKFKTFKLNDYRDLDMDMIDRLERAVN